jgi:hypothetical protein
MAKSPEQGRKKQLTLFQESLPNAPVWEEFREEAHIEVVRLLAQLLLRVRAGKATRRVFCGREAQ